MVSLSSSLEYDQVPPIMSQQQELEEGSLDTRRASSSDDNGQSRFLFVLENNQPETRTHAMRAHWQERRERKKETTVRLLHPKPETSISSTPTPKSVQVSTSYKCSASTTTQEEWTDIRWFTPVTRCPCTVSNWDKLCFKLVDTESL